MPTLGEKIRSLRKERGWSQMVLGQMVNVSHSAISQWEADKIVPAYDSLNALSSLFSTSFLAFDSDIEISRAAIGRAPVIRIEDLIAGLPSSIFAKNSVELASAPRGMAFATKMPDRSMQPNIRLGDLVIVDTGLGPVASDYVFIVLRGRPTVRRLRLGKNNLQFISENEDFRKETFLTTDPNYLMVGVVVETRWQRERSHL